MNAIRSVIAGSISLVAVGSPANAQTNYQFPVLAEAGDRFVIEYTDEQVRNGDGIAVKFGAEMVIGDVFDDSFVATWTTTSATVGGIVVDMANPRAADYFLGVPIEFIAAADGTPAMISDRVGLMNTLFEGALSAVLSDDATTALRNFFDSMTDEALAKILLKAPTYIATCQGMDLSLGEPYTSNVQMPSPIGGGGFVPATMSYTLESIDKEARLAHIEYRMEIDPEALKQMLNEMFERLPDGRNKPTQAEVDAMSFERSDSASCDIDSESGWARSTTYRTRIDVAGEYQLETYDFRIDRIPFSTP